MKESIKKGPFEVLSSHTVYQSRWIHLREDIVIRPDGEKGTFGIIEMRPGSTVLAINQQKEAYLVKEYKFAIENESLELMSGAIDADESPLDAAKRELKEETGLDADEWVDFGVVNPFTTVVRSPNYIFLALGVHEGESKPESGEILEVIKAPFDDVIKMAMNSQITHGASCVLILKAATYLRERGII